MKQRAVCVGGCRIFNQRSEISLMICYYLLCIDLSMSIVDTILSHASLSCPSDTEFAVRLSIAAAYSNNIMHHCFHGSHYMLHAGCPESSPFNSQNCNWILFAFTKLNVNRCCCVKISCQIALHIDPLPSYLYQNP